MNGNQYGAYVYSCYAFNGDISRWNVSGVQNMKALFDNAESFNIDVSRWDVGSVTNMEFPCLMKQTLFNQDLSNWNFVSVTNMRSDV
ncbi:MAG: BspA family leucine-rich repeat surface protein [Chitinophagales bacterium]